MGAAFDLVDVKVFDGVLHRLNIDPWLRRILVDFLLDRSAFVKLGEHQSEPFSLDVGCAQGSTLGPKIFNIYVSELLQIETEGSRIVSYADDSYVIVSASNKELMLAKLKLLLKNHLDWLGSIGMHSNVAKTEAMVMFDDNITTLGEFSTSLKMKVLGFIFDNKLKWNYHVDSTVNKTKMILHSLRKIKRFLTKSELKKVVTAHAFSLLFYGIELWFSLSCYRDRNRIRSVYYSLVRLMMYESHWTSRSDLDQISGRATCDQWNQFCVAKQMIRIHKSKMPHRLYEAIRQNSYYKSRQTGRVFYYVQSQKKVGLQSLANRLKDVSDAVNFDWLNSMTVPQQRASLKQCFFPFFNVPPA